MVSTSSTSSNELRKDVRFLTTLLGDVIREQEGDGLFQKIEEIRLSSKKIRQSPRPELIEKQKNYIDSLDLDETYKIARAFTIHFQLVNIAEEMQRVRRIREYEKDSSLFQEMSVHKLFKDLKKNKISAERILKAMSQMDIELVLTAHPTETKRSTILDHLLRIASSLFQLNRVDTTLLERQTITHSIKETLEILWQTAEIRQRKVQVLDEVAQTLFYFKRTILDLAPTIHEKVCSEFARVYGNDKKPVGPIVRFGSWVGSDRDGNPNVTCAITKKTAARHREVIFGAYLSAVEDLIRKFSQSLERTKVSEKLFQSIEEDKKILPDLAKELEQFEPKEIYRKKLSFIHQKLLDALHKKKSGYVSPKEFIADLCVIRESLAAHKGVLAADGDIRRLIGQVEVFGFHLARLDFRDHTKKIRGLFTELFPGEPWEEKFILSKILGPSKSLRRDGLSQDSQDVLEQLATIREIKEGDERLADDYILSMTESPEDVLGLLYLAKETGLVKMSGRRITESRIGIVPLFETISALDRAHEILERLFSLPVYKSYLRSKGSIQEVMLGYSDSSKDGGYLTANWKLYLTQKKLIQTAERYKIALKLFHGKGGSIDRGGGESHRAILAQPYAAVKGLIKITEQGEVVSQKYANPVIAQRNLEQLITAVFWTNLVTKKETAKNSKIVSWEGRMETLSALSYRFYRDFIYGEPGFLEFYHQATPIRVLQMARIGSRPAMRSEKKGFEDLRAIPWVFSWIQSRYIISAWFGMGFALENYIRERGADGLSELKEMYAGWPFFKSLIHNIQISLAKTDLGIANQYADLVANKELRERVHALICGEYARTVETVLKVSSGSELLDFYPVLKESIRVRNPYVDPLNYLQLRFLREISQDKIASYSEDEQKKIQTILLLTVNGIAFGMKSTG